MISIQELLRRDIATLRPYTPILPLDVLADQLGIPVERLVKLDANENPYGPSPRAVAMLAAHPHYAIYPDPEHRHLRALLADYTGQSAERIICGAGADELIDVLLRAFVAPGETMINCPPTFGMYAFLGGVQGARVVSVERDENFALDIEAIADAAEQHHAKMLFLTQPNNPTGNAMPRRDIERLLELPLIVVVDEAYIEFAQNFATQGTENTGKQIQRRKNDEQSLTVSVPSVSFMANLVGRHENLVVLRTFSKWAGLAGLRVGYALGHEALLHHLWKIKQPYNVNAAALVAAEASLHDVAYLRGNVARIVAERARMFSALSVFEWLHVYPSAANFLLCRIQGSRASGQQPEANTTRPSSALGVKEALMRQGILVRHYKDPHLSDCIRISIGTPQQNDAVLAALGQMT